MRLNVEYSAEGDAASLSLHGEIDLATVHRLRSAIDKAIAAGASRLTLDLDAVTYLDSSGLGALIAVHKRLELAGGTLTVICSQARLLRLLRITGLDKVLTVTGREHGVPEQRSTR